MSIRNFYQQVRVFFRTVTIEHPKDKRLPRLGIDEAYASAVKWLARAIMLLSIGSAFLVVPNSFVGAGIAVLFVAAEKFFESRLLTVRIMILTAIPDGYEAGDWLGVAWGIHSQDEKPVGFDVSLIFKNCDSARSVFDAMREWNYGRDVDASNNIEITVVLEDDGTYGVYIGPNPLRPSIKAAIGEAMKENRDRVVHTHVLALFFRKLFPPTASGLKNFRAHYKDGTPYEFQPVVLGDNGRPSKCAGIEPIRKYHLQISKRSELHRKDFAYQVPIPPQQEDEEVRPTEWYTGKLQKPDEG